MADEMFKLRDLRCSADPTHPMVLDAWTRKTADGTVETRNKTTGEVLQAMCAGCGARLEHALTRLNLGGVPSKADRAADYPGRDFPVSVTEPTGGDVELVHVDRGDRVSTIFTRDGHISPGDLASTKDKATGKIDFGVVKGIQEVSRDPDGARNQRLFIESKLTATPQTPVKD